MPRHPSANSASSTQDPPTSGPGDTPATSSDLPPRQSARPNKGTSSRYPSQDAAAHDPSHLPSSNRNEATSNPVPPANDPLNQTYGTQRRIRDFITAKYANFYFGPANGNGFCLFDSLLQLSHFYFDIRSSDALTLTRALKSALDPLAARLNQQDSLGTLPDLARAEQTHIKAFPRFTNSTVVVLSGHLIPNLRQPFVEFMCQLVDPNQQFNDTAFFDQSTIPNDPLQPQQYAASADDYIFTRPNPLLVLYLQLNRDAADSCHYWPLLPARSAVPLYEPPPTHVQHYFKTPTHLLAATFGMLQITFFDPDIRRALSTLSTLTVTELDDFLHTTFRQQLDPLTSSTRPTAQSAPSVNQAANNSDTPSFEDLLNQIRNHPDFSHAYPEGLRTPTAERTQRSKSATPPFFRQQSSVPTNTAHLASPFTAHNLGSPASVNTSYDQFLKAGPSITTLSTPTLYSISHPKVYDFLRSLTVSRDKGNSKPLHAMIDPAQLPYLEQIWTSSLANAKFPLLQFRDVFYGTLTPREQDEQLVLFYNTAYSSQIATKLSLLHCADLRDPASLATYISRINTQFWFLRLSETYKKTTFRNGFRTFNPRFYAALDPATQDPHITFNQLLEHATTILHSSHELTQHNNPRSISNRYPRTGHRSHYTRPSGASSATRSPQSHRSSSPHHHGRSHDRSQTPSYKRPYPFDHSSPHRSQPFQPRPAYHNPRQTTQHDSFHRDPSPTPSHGSHGSQRSFGSHGSQHSHNSQASHSSASQRPHKTDRTAPKTTGFAKAKPGRRHN